MIKNTSNYYTLSIYLKKKPYLGLCLGPLEYSSQMSLSYISKWIANFAERKET